MGNCCSIDDNNHSNQNVKGAIYQQPPIYSQPPYPQPIYTQRPLPPLPISAQGPTYNFQHIQQTPIYNIPSPRINSYINDNSLQGDFGGYSSQSPIGIFGQPNAYDPQKEAANYDASDAASISSINAETTVESHCFNCTSKVVDIDLDGYPSEYCSDQCRKDASYAGFANPVCILCKEYPQVTNSKFCGKKRCRNLPKCYLCKVKDVHKGSLWCSKSCRDRTPNWQSLTVERANYMCLVCNREFALKGRDFCRDDCEQWVKTNVPCLLKLPQNAEKYKDVLNQFKIAWKHPHKRVPQVHSIWKIYCNNILNNRYNAYKAEVESIQQLKGKPFPKGEGQRTMSVGNEQRRFHGTKMKCQVGLKDNKICIDKQCSVCAIIREGYKLKYVGTGTISAAFQRFGSGIYFSGTSSKSDDYNEGSLINYLGANYKVMLLNKLVVGKGYALTKDAMTLTSPPDGYDSVLGEPSTSGNLNYDEVVVYKEEASIPQYLIVYETL
ncbi:10859_t:CDS:2 [Funneliformis geosporum]|uniref:18168_t:CDS:1 n=1 Tax=Funneliformis geosporum TaxID=1117311 RepID=A0A9W4SBW6_9GLOM|nr:10859_t:CDS:2 [Funneliformis geosporum]CAI2163405.1 18168_t:CDS:2 [Funneliformis geosporum]